MTDLVLLTGEQQRYDYALTFAKLQHGLQQRKYTGEPYWHHVAAVAALVSQVRHRSMEMIEAALLHDTIEDTVPEHERGVLADRIATEFGPTVRAYVELLTDPPRSFGNREARNQVVRLRMLTAASPVKTVKLADLIDNTRTIVEYDPGFAKVYLQEKSNLLTYLVGGDQGLWNRARELADQPV